MKIPAVPEVGPASGSGRPAQEAEAAPASRTAAAPEPSVLDFLRSRLSFGRRPRIELPELATHLPAAEASPESVPSRVASVTPAASMRPGLLDSLPWRSLLALGLALLGQGMYEPPARGALGGSLSYAL
ncbi:MAG TPA: hypothetical protein VLL49_12425, partial [Anaerolineales bacterium]|nr:hypothetical protein [Anaerolineales bacterium]